MNATNRIENKRERIHFKCKELTWFDIDMVHINAITNKIKNGSSE